MEDGRLSIVLIYKNPRALPSSPISDDIYMNHTRRLDGILVGLVSKYLAQSATSKTTRLHLWEEPLEIEKVGITYELGLVIFLYTLSFSHFTRHSVDRWMDATISLHIILILYSLFCNLVGPTHNRRVCCSFIKTGGLDAVELPSYIFLFVFHYAKLNGRRKDPSGSIRSLIPLKKKRRQRRGGCCDWI
jgi:hypothetical protein